MGGQLTTMATTTAYTSSKLQRAPFFPLHDLIAMAVATG